MWEIERAVFGAEAWSLEMMREELQADHRRYVVLADDSGEVRGYAGVLVIGDESDIQTIAVQPGLQGSGHGRALMNTLLDTAAERGATQTFLEVRADKPVPRALYASLGFSEIGIRPRYYQPDDVDAIVMRLDMKERR